MIAQAQVQLCLAPAEVRIKGDPQASILRAGEGLAVIGDKDPRLRPVAGLKLGDLCADLPRCTDWQVPR